MCQRCSKWALLSTNKVFVAARALLASAIREGGATAAALNNLAIVYKTFEKEFQKELSNIDAAAVSRIYSNIELCYNVL